MGDSMRHPHRLSSAMTLWSAVLLVLLCAAAPVPGQHGLPEGADEVIETTLESYRTGDTEAYASCLAPDFVFVLHENPRPIFDADPPLLWDREAELLVHAELFGGGGDAPTVLSVDLHPYGAYETVTDETGAELLIVKLRGSVDAEIRGVLFRCATGHVLYLREPAGEVDDWKIVRWEEIDPHLPDIYYEAQGISEEPWCRVAESTARLYWYGHEFEGPIEFSMQGRHLTINGQPVPLHHALSCRPEDVPVTPYMQLDRRADAASTFDEWAQIYEESALVEGLALGGQSMTFRWTTPTR